METILLVAVGLAALCIIVYMTLGRSEPPCGGCSQDCDTCNLYRSAQQKTQAPECGKKPEDQR